MRVRAIFWKELIELKRMAAWRLRVVVLPLLLAVWFGFFSWVTYRFEPAAWAWLVMVFFPALPAILAAYFASESVVGERERHTLETMLASPIDGLELLLGKVLAHLVLFAALSLLAFFVLWVAAFPAAPGFPVPPPGAIAAGVILFLHLFLFSETIGLFVGQRARTVASANSVVAPFFILPFMVFMVLPSLSDAALERLEEAPERIVWLVLAILVAAVWLVVVPLAVFVLRKARAERMLA